MTKENFKTLFLISLVCFSIILARKLWMGAPMEFMPSVNDKAREDNTYIIKDMVVPHKYLLNFSEMKHTLFYSDEKYELWLNGKELLTKVFLNKDFEIKEISNKEFTEYQNKKSISFYFSQEINTYILAKSLGINHPNDISKNLSKVDNIYICLEKEDPFVVLGFNNKFIKINKLNIQTKKLRHILNTIEDKGNYTYYYSMKETLGSKNDIYIPYEMSESLPTTYVNNKIDMNDENKIKQIVEKFFDKDIDYLRQILEDNGSVIYIYNQRVLKIHQNGILEYFCPIEQPVKERNLYISLNTVSKFISNHVGVLKGIYVDKIEEIESDNNLGYRFTFKYRMKGIPVILGSNEIENFIQIEVFNDYVKSFKSFMRKDTDNFNYNDDSNKKMLSAFDVINYNYDLMKHNFLIDIKKDKKLDSKDINYQMESSIQDISLAYFDPCDKATEQKLICVWMIKVKDRIYAFDVYTGKLVYEGYRK